MGPIRKSKSKISSRYPSKKESGSRKNDNIIFIICIVIAFVFWGLIKLSEVYNVTYAFNIEYNNVPVEKRLTGMVDSTVHVNFSARGFMVLRLNLFEDMSKLSIDLDNYSMLKEGDEYFIYTQELKDKLAEIIGIDETDINFSESTIGFMLENLHEKVIGVKANLSLNFNEQYDLYNNEIISPVSVKVYGPKATIDTLNEVLTQNINLQSLDKDQVILVGLLNPKPSLLRFDPDQVEIQIRVEKFTESSIEIPIDLSNVRKNIQLFPTSVKVYFKVAQKDFNNIQAGEFMVKPDIKGVNLTEVDRLHLTLTRKPGFIRNERIIPAYVEFLINK